MKKHTGGTRFLAIALLALIVGLTACGQTADPNKITGVVVSPSEVSLKVGSADNTTAQLKAEFEHESGELADAEVNWESSDAEIATVSAAGLVTAVAAGEAIVTATAKTNPELFGTASIAIAPADEEDPAEEDPGEGVPGGEEPGNGEPGDGGPGDGEPGGEEPSDGEPGGEEPGDGEPGGEEPSDEVPVVVTLDHSDLDMVRTQSLVLTAVVTGADEGEEGVTWSTSREAVVTISPDGNEATLTANGNGYARITATSSADPSATASLVVRVIPLRVAAGFEFDPPAVGASGELTATISNTFADADLDLTWTAEPADLIQLDETTSGSGEAIAFTASKAGEVTVTATSAQDAAVQASMTFEIESATLDPTNVYVGGTISLATADPGTRFNPFEAIDQGVGAVDEGGTVHITGEFMLDSTLVIDKPNITLLGKPGNKISPVEGTMPADPRDSARLMVISATGSGVTLDSLHFEVIASSSFGHEMVHLEGSTGITIKNSTFSGDWSGGDGLDARGLRVLVAPTPLNLEINGNSFENIAYPARFYGHTDNRDSANIEITGNHAVGTKSWLLAGVPAGITLSGNTFENSVCDSATAAQITFAPEGSHEIDGSYLGQIENISSGNDSARVRYLPTGGGETVFAGTECHTDP